MRRGTDSSASLPARPHALLELLAEVLHDDDGRRSHRALLVPRQNHQKPPVAGDVVVTSTSA